MSALTSLKGLLYQASSHMVDLIYLTSLLVYYYTIARGILDLSHLDGHRRSTMAVDFDPPFIHTMQFYQVCYYDHI